MEKCPPGPGRGEVDYLPLAVGETWVFDYTSWYGSGTLHGTGEGTRTWTFESAGECRWGRRPYQVLEVFEGTFYADGSPPSSFTNTEPVTIEVLGDSVLFPFWPKPVPRFGPASGPDTLRYNSGMSHLYGGEFVALRLVRDRGLVWFSESSSDKSSQSGRQYKRRDEP